MVSVALLDGARLRFLKDGNLPGMVELVLRDSVQHEIEIVSLARNPLAEARLGQGRHRFHQYIVRAFDMSHGFAPLRFSGSWNDREIRGARKLNFLPPQPPGTCGIPGSDVQRKFPDAVHIG